MGRPRGNADIQEIQEMRESLGMRPLPQGFRSCYRCGFLFWSEDLDHVRHCEKCRKSMDILSRSTATAHPMYHNKNRHTGG